MAIHVQRRAFIGALGGAATWPLVARAQQGATPVVGFFSWGSPGRRPWTMHAAAFRQGLQEIGFVEGCNLTIEYAWAEDRDDRVPALAADLARRRAEVIAAGPRTIDAAKAAATTIPIVFMSGGDPVRVGLVASLNRPGGNLTGFRLLASDITTKRFSLLHDLVPQATVIGVLSDPAANDLRFKVQEVQAAANSLGVPIEVIAAGTEGEVETAFATFARKGVTAVFVIASLFSYSRTDFFAARAAHHRIALSGELRVFVESGGFMSYGPSETEAFRGVGRYTGRILKGEKPADLPVQQPTKFEFVLNMKTAKALGLTVPYSMQMLADEVIE
jgi:putative ABC transport system substrate-binding protein